MRHEHSRILFSYWNELRQGRLAPERTEIEPVEIRQILGDTFILEISEQLRAISFRLAGTRLCSAHGRELKGLGFLVLWREEDNFDIARAITKVWRDYKPALVSYAAHAAEGNCAEYEMLLLPLAPAADGNARILGVASPRKAPYWLGAQALTANHLRHIRYLDSHAAAPGMATPVASQIAEYKPADGKGGRKVAHLTVHDGGRNEAGTAE